MNLTSTAPALNFPRVIAQPAPAPSPSQPHLKAGAFALAVTILSFCAIHLGVRLALPARLPEFASRTSPIKLSGNVLQECAFQTPGVMPLYGSSELDRAARNRPDAFFRHRPTGFSTFPIGRGGTTCLMILQKLAAAGASVHGKKTAIFLSPSWFLKEEVGENAVDGNLTADQVGAWIFSDALSAQLKHEIAVRLQDYPHSLDGEPMLTTALDCLSSPTLDHRLLLSAVAPLGWLQNLFYQQIEYCAILHEMVHYSKGLPPDQEPVSAAIDWDRLAATADSQDRADDDGLSFSAVQRTIRDKERFAKAKLHPKQNRDADFMKKIIEAKEWADLDLLMRGLKELGADAVFIDQPFNGVYRDLGGTTPTGRQPYYQRLAERIHAGGFPLRDFPDHEEDRYFFNDTGHPSAKAWVYYDHALDDFYHGKPE